MTDYIACSPSPLKRFFEIQHALEFLGRQMADTERWDKLRERDRRQIHVLIDRLNAEATAIKLRHNINVEERPTRCV